MTRQELWEAMVNKIPVTINGLRGLIQAIELEDGSGYSFNVTILWFGNQVRTKVYMLCNKPNYRH